jgi:hypothetical protein
MALLTVAVLVGLGRLDRLPLQAVVPQQRLVTLGERRPRGPRRHGGRQSIRAVQLRHAAQFRQGILQPRAEALVALREADRPGLPVRVRQHEMVEQVVERHALDRHAQVAAVREITGTQPAWMMYLAEEHFLGAAVQGPPLLDAPLERPQLAVSELTGEAPLKIAEQRLGLQAGVEAERLFQLRPDGGERIRFGTPVSVHESHLAGQPAQLPILAGGLRIEAGPGRRQLLGDTLAVATAKTADL